MTEAEREKQARDAAESLWMRLRMHTSPMAGMHLGERQYGVTFWDESTPWVLDILAGALTKPPGGCTGVVYGELLNRWLNALRDAQSNRAETLFALVEAYRTEYPEECKEWESYWGSSKA